MTAHDAYLDRMTERLGQLESRIRDLKERAGRTDTPEARRTVADLEASLEVTRARLHELRRAGADLTTEMTQSFGAGFERLNAAVGRADSELR
ncbi:MAG TPA: hypothetical protein VFG43_09325 [Geminicoccaceae bacterium]|nr:hypothetical protein [Geminicoccaceae bacterium]